MPRDRRKHRPRRPAVGKPRRRTTRVVARERAVASLLVPGARRSDVFTALHQRALAVTHGQCSLLFEVNPRNGALHATSGFALDELPIDPWLPADVERGLVDEAFAERAPTLVTDTARLTPDLASRLGTASALLVPLSADGHRAGVLTIGFPGAPTGPGAIPELTDVADAFVVAIELFRLRHRQDVQRDLRDLLDRFATHLAGTLDLDGGLETLCAAARTLFGADRTSVWIHDRQASQLVLRASSDRAHVARGLRLRTDDPAAVPAAAMRRGRAEIVPSDDDASTIRTLVPLRGTRRALGALVFDGVRVEPGAELDVLDRAEELGRQLSNAIESVQLLDELVRSRRELEDVFDAIPYLIIVTDRLGHIVHANRTFTQRIGSTRERVIGSPLAACVGPELGAWLTAINDLSSSTRTVPASCEVVDPVLKGPLFVNASDRLDGRGASIGLVIIARDLTPENRLDVEREELRQRVSQSEKFSALGQFIAGVAHELNNPLQGVIGHLDLLQATEPLPATLSRQIRVVSREADRAAKIVRNLLVFTGAGQVRRRAVNVHAVLQRVLGARQAGCEAEHIEVVRHYDQRLPRVYGDPVLLHQVFLNVIMNAEQAIAGAHRAGRIEIATAASPADDRVVITIRDTGPGIKPEALTRVFEPFYTTKEVGQGTGLGLAIAYGIVQEDGGRISAANHPSGGALFTIELPAAPATGR